MQQQQAKEPELSFLLLVVEIWPRRSTGEERPQQLAGRGLGGCR